MFLLILRCSASCLAGVALFALAGLASPSLAAADFRATDRQPTPEELAQLPGVIPEKAAALRRDVRVPPEFDFTIFATPPAVNYPVFIAAAPDGTLYVSSDGNGSLDRKPHRGRVLRVRDTNGDGQADEVKAFVPDVDSPRGLVWDHDRLYLLHPPNISVYVDQDGDGVMDEEKTLVTGIGWSFKDRPADHASNGLELGIDGWLYAAIGDFGFMNATGTDGRKLQLRGGGVVRVRPDGTGLELFASGTRNILETAVSPLLDVFARDNTNDGGGWDVRFHHFSGLTEHGYPRLFKNFRGEFLEPLADFGGGSGCGAAWIDEPGIPAKWNNSPFTCDWGRERIYHHEVGATGATFTASQDEFIRLPRATDLDVDARSAIYAASWKGATFTWVGPEAGFLIRVTPKGFRPEPLPDFENLSEAELLKQFESPSHRRRLEAQRTLIRKYAGSKSKSVGAALFTMAADHKKILPARVAAIFALKMARGLDANPLLEKLTRDAELQPWALRALADRTDQMANVHPSFLLEGLKATSARARREAAFALARLGQRSFARALIPLLADSDPVVAHTAVQTLVRLDASDACFAALDNRKSSPALRTGALRVLQTLHEPQVVQGITRRLDREAIVANRAGLLTALCRLHFREGPWKGDSWGTRPDTRGPYYQPETWSESPGISATIKAALDRADAHESAFIGRELARHRIPAGDAMDLLIARAATEPSLLPAIAAQLASAESIPSNAIPLLIRTASADDTSDAIRAQAVIALAMTDSADGWRALLIALPRVKRTQTENNLSEKAQNSVDNAPKLDRIHAVFEDEAARVNGESSLLAEGLLLELASRKFGSPEAREASNRSLDLGWTDPQRRVQILHAAAAIRDSTRAAQFVTALTDPNATVAAAARETVKRLNIRPEKFRAAAKSPRVGDLPVSQVLDVLMQTQGEVSRGQQLFAQIGCNACHTVKADEPLKGPFLGAVATIYKRRELGEAILLPNKTIAQGFAANHFELKDGTEIDGFVVREAADAITVRTIAAQEQIISVTQIVKREKQEKSLMPEGLVTGLSLPDLASLVDYLQSLSKTN